MLSEKSDVCSEAIDTFVDADDLPAQLLVYHDAYVFKSLALSVNGRGSYAIESNGFNNWNWQSIEPASYAMRSLCDVVCCWS